ncbi:MAG: adenosylcobinamide kinase/adenosylcobinamide phosphate guanyltransferase [Cyanobium sp. NAT70]|nr:adenosylcobinamide kinase/adenosylcobinamide phosphate guanyltransferase [Cyanobium sp. NAT70]
MEVDKHRPDNGSFVLVSGPSRGGKSAWAESLLRNEALVTYVATSPDFPEDTNWQERLNRHRRQRPPEWNLIESGPNLTESLSAIREPGALLIDSLGGFVGQHLDQSSEAWNERRDALVQQLSVMSQTRVLVIEETGWGVVPSTKVGGLFRDRLGETAQLLQTEADDSWLVIQGRAINIQSLGVPVR